MLSPAISELSEVCRQLGKLQKAVLASDKSEHDRALLLYKFGKFDSYRKLLKACKCPEGHRFLTKKQSKLRVEPKFCEENIGFVKTKKIGKTSSNKYKNTKKNDKEQRKAKTT
jgi:hypothetical protein